MRRLLFLLFVTLLFIPTLQAQTSVYHPFPDSNAFWGDRGWNLFYSGLCYNTRYGINGDMTIGAYNYHMVFSLYDSTLTNPNSTFFAAIREEDKRVYVILDTFPEEILYDFNLEVGDTITHHISLMFNMPDTFSRVVTQIDSVLLENGEYRKRWFFDPASYPPHYSTEDVVIEGIGSMSWRGLFNPLFNAMATNGDQFSFECFKHNDTVLYLNNPLCNRCFCSFLTDIEEGFTKSELSFSPNPTSTSFSIQLPPTFGTLDKLEIFNSVGQMVGRYKTVENIDISGYPKGLYFVVVTGEGGERLTGRVVKE